MARSLNCLLKYAMSLSVCYACHYRMSVSLDAEESGDITPYLRVWLKDSPPHSPSVKSAFVEDSDSSHADSPTTQSGELAADTDLPVHHPQRRSPSLLWTLQHQHASSSTIDLARLREPDEQVSSPPSPSAVGDTANSVLVPLEADSSFFTVLVHRLRAIAELQERIASQFNAQLEQLSVQISNAARPRSESSRSDLDSWRAIFQLYVDTQVFESQ